MLTLSGSLRVFLALEPCDMRKSFDGLHAEVINRLGDDPRGGAGQMGYQFSRINIQAPRLRVNVEKTPGQSYVMKGVFTDSHWGCLPSGRG